MLQEELAAANLQKYRQLQAQLESAEERADTAEQNLTRVRSHISSSPAHKWKNTIAFLQMRAKSRTASVAPAGASSTGLAVRAKIR